MIPFASSRLRRHGLLEAGFDAEVVAHDFVVDRVLPRVRRGRVDRVTAAAVLGWLRQYVWQLHRRHDPSGYEAWRLLLALGQAHPDAATSMVSVQGDLRRRRCQLLIGHGPAQRPGDVPLVLEPRSVLVDLDVRGPREEVVGRVRRSLARLAIAGATMEIDGEALFQHLRARFEVAAVGGPGDRDGRPAETDPEHADVMDARRLACRAPTVVRWACRCLQRELRAAGRSSRRVNRLCWIAQETGRRALVWLADARGSAADPTAAGRLVSTCCDLLTKGIGELGFVPTVSELAVLPQWSGLGQSTFYDDLAKVRAHLEIVRARFRAAAREVGR
ncbi:MAG: hypothetical protein IPM29_04545 [Planctomycetes bacterium]|nr:hypothetical protein [Planctomycetota bacterium]